jgi:hypothetical protein
MLRKVLQAMSTGDVHSHAGLARRLDISEGLLLQMMEDLARKGYLATLGTSLDCDGCGGCSGRQTCNGRRSGKASTIKGWTLTAKGRDAAKR